MSLLRPLPPKRSVRPSSGHEWVVIDVETSGLHARSHRVLSIAAIALDRRGHPEQKLHTLIDAGCDPGPVHIHGLTRERLAGAPRFTDVLPALRKMLDGRVLVAHQAQFDYGFLAAEAFRANTTLPTRQRLCTLTLSRRLGVAVPNHQLATLAQFWGVQHAGAHDALDDATALTEVLRHSLSLAHQLGMPLPYTDCDGHVGPAPYPPRTVKTPCLWRCPGRLQTGAPLVQGMKIVITGDTRTPREDLTGRLGDAGLEVMNSVSRLTSVLVRNDQSFVSVKTDRAAQESTPVIDETTLLELMQDVRPGAPRLTAAGPLPAVRRPRTSLPRGPLAGRRVLIAGGTHEQAADVRGQLAALGAAVAVNLSANITDVVLLDDSHDDKRVQRARQLGVTVHATPIALGVRLAGQPATAAQPVTVPAGPEAAVAAGAQAGPQQSLEGTEAQTGPAVLSRGAVVDLPEEDAWTINVAWRADILAGAAELDVLALLVDADSRTVTDEDVVFYNAPIGEDGAVSLSVDGDSEQSIRIDLSLLPAHCSRIVIAGALGGTTTFGDLGAVTVSVDGASSTAATATLDAGTIERTMILAEVYRRGAAWRVRAVGQGYEDDLAHLLQRYGVAVD